MTQKGERIDPCPFCGGESYVRETGSGNLWEAFCNDPECEVAPRAVKDDKQKAIAAWEDRGSNSSSSPVAGVMRPDELNRIRQWFNSVQDLSHESYLESEDYRLAKRILEALDMRVPSEVKEGAA